MIVFRTFKRENGDGDQYRVFVGFCTTRHPPHHLSPDSCRILPAGLALSYCLGAPCFLEVQQAMPVPSADRDWAPGDGLSWCTPGGGGPTVPWRLAPQVEFLKALNVLTTMWKNDLSSPAIKLDVVQVGWFKEEENCLLW